MLTFSIAKRYLFAKKSSNIINIITGISIFGISIGTAALILILSVFNGFEDLLSNMLNNFNPDLKVLPVKGKSFSLDTFQLEKIKSIEGVTAVSKVIEEFALFEFNNATEIGVLKGVDDQFRKVVDIDSTMVYGNFQLKDKDAAYLVFGIGLQTKLGLSINDPLASITVYMPLAKKHASLGKQYITRSAYPAGSFSTGGDADYKMVISSYDFASRLIKSTDKISHLEIKLSEEKNSSIIIEELTSILGEGFDIKDRYQQEESFLKLMNIEKWISYLIGSLMLFLITFNLAGLLWVVVLDKKKDIAILKSMGMDSKMIKQIFLMEGLLIASFGTLIGIIMALIIYYLQVNYALVTVPSGLMIEAYPIKLNFTDFVAVPVTLLVLAYLSSIFPAIRASNVTAFVRQE